MLAGSSPLAVRLTASDIQGDTRHLPPSRWQSTGNREPARQSGGLGASPKQLRLERAPTTTAGRLRKHKHATSGTLARAAVWLAAAVPSNEGPASNFPPPLIAMGIEGLLTIRCCFHRAYLLPQPTVPPAGLNGTPSAKILRSCTRLDYAGSGCVGRCSCKLTRGPLLPRNTHRAGLVPGVPVSMRCSASREAGSQEVRAG